MSDTGKPADSVLQAIRGVVGAGACITDASAIEPYVKEWRGLVHGHCSMVVRPASTEEVSRVLALCNDARIPVTPQGGNTGMVAAAVPQGGIVVSTERMQRIRELDRDNATMTVDGGCILQRLQEAAEGAGYFLPLSLGAQGSCRIGGNLATNAGGVMTVRFGNARDMVLGLEVVLANGRIWNGLRTLRKNNTGYDLKHLFIGSEGTLGVITAAALKLFPGLGSTQTVLGALNTPDDVLRLFVRLRAALGDDILAFETFPGLGMELVLRHIPDTRNPFPSICPQYALLQAFGHRRDESLREALDAALAAAYEDGLIRDAVIAESRAQANALWRIRETIPEAHAKEGATIRHDVSVPVSRVPKLIALGTALVEKSLTGARVIAFGHIGDGNIHFNVLQPRDMGADAFLAHTPTLNRAVHDLVDSLGGSFSAEHGIGVVKREDMIRYRSTVEIEMMRGIKTLLDPNNIMNPGKIFMEV